MHTISLSIMFALRNLQMFCGAYIIITRSSIKYVFETTQPKSTKDLIEKAKKRVGEESICDLQNQTQNNATKIIPGHSPS